MSEIKVSVCVTTYNHERWIAQAVESALAQRISFPMEIVIGEDGSSDKTPEILADLAKRQPQTIRLQLNERNIGGKPNFLATIARCKGQYVAMLDGDDYWTCADKLQRQVDALDARADWAMCFHPCACLYEEAMQGIPIYPLGWTKPVATIEDLFVANFIPTSSVLFRNRLFPEFPLWFHDLLIGDWPLHILNAAHGDIGFLPEIMSAYRVHQAGVWSGATLAERIVAVFELLNAVDHHFAGKHTRAINTYRAETIRFVVSQLDVATNQIVETTEQLDTTRAQVDAQTLAQVHTQAQGKAYARAQERESGRATRLETQLRASQGERNRLQGDLAKLQEHYTVLEGNTRRLQDFYETWTKSILYRVEREIRRPIRRLRRYLQNLKDRSNGQSPDQQPPVSKAA